MQSKIDFRVVIEYISMIRLDSYSRVVMYRHMAPAYHNHNHDDD